jgi:hypothetical protein
MSAEAVFVSVILLVFLASVAMLVRLGERRLGRVHHQQRQATEIDLLDQPVMLPGRCGNGPYIERWSPDVDVWDVHLSKVHDVLWPQEQWLFVRHCPMPELNGYDDHAEALAHEPDGQSYECPCGRIHVDHRGVPNRRRRRRRAGRSSP